jgi:phosphate transport system substrate-binding protein
MAVSCDLRGMAKKSKMRLLVGASLGALALGAAACGSSSSSTSTSGGGSGSSASGTVNGAGSTFAAPVYQQWGSTEKGKGVTVNYQAVGSGAGVAALAQGTADFAGSDPALTPDDRKTLTKGEVVQIPMFFGAITASYNVSGVDKGLKLDGPTLANIFLGKITTWDDPAIKSLNPGVSLPSSKITVVHRSDESGTTKGFTTFLSNYSPEWKSKVGADKTVKWPTGTGAKGNDGVAASIKQTDGSIGYVEQAYALQNNFNTADVKNKSGKFIAPTLASTSAAGEGLTIPPDLGISSIDSANPAAYPIASQTFVDVYKDVCKAGMKEGDAKALGAFLTYGLGEGQASLGQLYYAKLPSELLSKSTAAAKSVVCNGSPIGG